MVLPDYTTQDAATYKANIDAALIVNTKIINIGNWDMQATPSVSIAHGLLDLFKIRSISVIIRHDTLGYIYDFNATDQNVSGVQKVVSSSTTYISLYRQAGGYFDNATFNDATINRGWITIQYID